MRSFFTLKQSNLSDFRIHLEQTSISVFNLIDNWQNSHEINEFTWKISTKSSNDFSKFQEFRNSFLNLIWKSIFRNSWLKTWHFSEVKVIKFIKMSHVKNFKVKLNWNRFLFYGFAFKTWIFIIKKSFLLRSLFWLRNRNERKSTKTFTVKHLTSKIPLKRAFVDDMKTKAIEI